jgi:hypothetical protein
MTGIARGGSPPPSAYLRGAAPRRGSRTPSARPTRRRSGPRSDAARSGRSQRRRRRRLHAQPALRARAAGSARRIAAPPRAGGPPPGAIAVAHLAPGAARSTGRRTWHFVARRGTDARAWATRPRSVAARESGPPARSQPVEWAGLFRAFGNVRCRGSPWRSRRHRRPDHLCGAVEPSVSADTIAARPLKRLLGHAEQNVRIAAARALGLSRRSPRRRPAACAPRRAWPVRAGPPGPWAGSAAT